MYIIRTHDRIMFKTCRRLWDFASINRRNLTPRDPDRNLFLGQGIHAALAAYYSPRVKADPVEAFTKWFENETEKIKEQLDYEVTDEWEERHRELYDLGVGMLEHYVIWAKQHDDFEVIETEVEFDCPVFTPNGKPSHARYRGRADMILRDSQGKLWIGEFKTFSQMSDVEERLLLDEQVSSYLWALTVTTGMRFEGVLFTVLRKKLPTKPQILKAGGLSQNKNIDTTYEVYLRAIEENGLDPREYQEILETLKAKGNTFFYRTRVRRNRAELKEIGNRIYYEYRDMTRKDLQIYPNPDPIHCRRCQFRVPCLAMNDGSDVEQLLTDLYMVRQSSEDSYAQASDLF